MEADLESVLNSHGLGRKDLDFKCPREIRDRIAAEVIDEWYLFGRTLKVSQEKLASIRRDSSLTPEEKAVDVLDAWAEEHGSRATCLTLARTLYGRKKMNVLEILCDEVKRHAATTSGAGAAVSPQPSEHQQQLAQQGHDIFEHDVEVVNRIEELDSRFRSLHKKIESKLESDKVTVRELIHSLTLLPHHLDGEYGKTFFDKHPDLRKEEEVSDIFCFYINPLVSFMDYGLTKHIIDEFGSNTLKKEMNNYSKDVVQFMKKTTVKKMMDHWPGPQEIHPNYTRLKVTINEDPRTYTLYEVDQLRKRYCSELKMSTLTFKIIGLKMSNSFIVEWLVPSALVPKLIESAKQLDFGFYLRQRILKVVVGEKQIFPFFPDSKPKVTAALQTTAALLVTDVKDDEETDPAATQLSSSVKQVRSDPAATQLSSSVKQVRSDPAAKLLPTSMEQLSLSPLEEQEVQWIRYKLGDSSLYSGVGIVYEDPFLLSSPYVERTLSELNFKYVDLGEHIYSHLVDLKTCLSIVAQSKAYPTIPSAAGSQPFVIAVFVTGDSGHSPCSLFTLRGESVDIVDDIIKPFLPKSAPHLAHIPKLFFINSCSWSHHRDLDTQPPSFPDDKDANYCIAYHLTRWVGDCEWMDTITHGLRSNMTVQDVIEESRSHLDKHNERLYTFSCLKEKLVLGKEKM